MIRVLVVDDQTLVRAGLRVLLASLAGIEVAGDTGSREEALRLAAELSPDVMVVDVAAKDDSVGPFVRKVTQDFPSTRVLVLTGARGSGSIREALQAGASACVLKTASEKDLELAVHALARGEAWFSPAVSRQVLDDYRHQAAVASPGASLTPRQREILQFIAQGRSTKEMAAALRVSVKTVETHRAQLMARLNIRDVAGLVRYAIRIGLVTVE